MLAACRACPRRPDRLSGQMQSLRARNAQPFRFPFNLLGSLFQVQSVSKAQVGQGWSVHSRLSLT